MTFQTPSWETLNAYVDGELPVGKAAEVARALARDRSLADQVACLTQLKAAVQETVRNLEDTIDTVVPGRLRRNWRPVALAASLLLAAAVGLAAIFIPRQGERPEAWVIQAHALHDAWVVAPEVTPLGIGGVVLVEQAQAQAGGTRFLRAYLPDLTSAKLTLTRVETVTLPQGGGLAGGVALHAGYRGTRGCKVSLLILPGGETLPRALTRRDDAALRAFAWRAGSLGYLLVAEGMDEARLQLIAATVYRTTLENSPFDAETRTALRESRDRSAPCLA